MVKPNLDLTQASWDELDEIAEAVLERKKEKALEHQNELIREYQELREKMVKAGVAKDEDLPKFKIRGWTRKKPH